MSSQDKLERIFIATLYLCADTVKTAIQIKPNYLVNPIHQKIFKIIMMSDAELGFFDESYVTGLLNGNELDVFTDIIAGSNTPIGNIKGHFLSTQNEILKNHKKRCIEELSKKLASGQLSVEEYLKKTEKISTIKIINTCNFLTLEELNDSLDVKKNRISLIDFPRLDNFLQLVENDFLVVGANTGTGKSALLINFMNSLMSKYQCIYFNLEMDRNTICSRMVSTASDVPIRYLNDPSTPHQKELIEKGKRKIVESKVIIEYKTFRLDDVETFIRMAPREKRHTVIFIDHLGLIRVPGKKTLYEQMTEVAKELRQVCFKYNVTIIAACQLNRTSSNGKITLSMLKDSGEVENSASKIILLSRSPDFSKEHLEPEMILDVAKNRSGMEGELHFIYEKSKQKFKEKGY